MSAGLPRRIVKVGSYILISFPSTEILGELAIFEPRSSDKSGNLAALELNFEFRFQETQRLVAEPVPGIKAEPHEENARYFSVIIDGPKDVSGFTVIFLLKQISLIAVFIVNQASFSGVLQARVHLKICFPAMVFRPHMMEENSSWSYFFQKSIPWRRRKFDL